MSAAWLCEVAPVFAPIVRRAGPFGLVARAAEPFEALVTAVAGQQLHARAAEAILRRMMALYPGVGFASPAMLLATEDAALRGCGFSGGKIAAVKGIAAAAAAGVVPSRAEAEGMTDAALIAQLTALRGVGRWTVEMLLIFTLGRGDVLPVDDFAIREGWRLLNNDQHQPKPKELARIGERWAPHRTTAAWYLWRAADEGKRQARPAALPPSAQAWDPAAA